MFTIESKSNLKVFNGDVLLENPTFSLLETEVKASMYDIVDIGTNSTDSVLDMGNVFTGKYLIIKTNNAITVKLTQTTDRTVTLSASGCLLLTGTFTAVKVTNSSGTLIAQVEYLVAGDRV